LAGIKFRIHAILGAVLVALKLLFDIFEQCTAWYAKILVVIFLGVFAIMTAYLVAISGAVAGLLIAFILAWAQEVILSGICRHGSRV